MSAIAYILFVAAIVAADQLTKALTVASIPLYGSVEVLPGLFSLTYVQNTGAAFSFLEGQQWVFVLVFAVFTGFLLWEHFKKPLPFSAFERWCIAAIYGGGLGNMIDRLRLGYVVDMIKTEFMNFPVFNVADCFITCGTIALAVSVLVFDRSAWEGDKT